MPYKTVVRFKVCFRNIHFIYKLQSGDLQYLYIYSIYIYIYIMCMIIVMCNVVCYFGVKCCVLHCLALWIEKENGEDNSLLHSPSLFKYSNLNRRYNGLNSILIQILVRRTVVMETGHTVDQWRRVIPLRHQQSRGPGQILQAGHILYRHRQQLACFGRLVMFQLLLA